MERQDHIGEIFESIKGMQKAVPSPFLFEQITQRISKGEKMQLKISPFMKWGLAAVVLIILSLNVLSVAKSNTIASEENIVSYFNTIKTYNY